MLLEFFGGDDVVVRVIGSNKRWGLQLWLEFHLEDVPFLGLMSDDIEFLQTERKGHERWDTTQQMLQLLPAIFRQ